MKTLILSLVILFSLTSFAGDLVIEIPQSIQVTYTDNGDVVKDKNLDSIDTRLSLGDFFFPDYYYANGITQKETWIKFGYTVLKDNPSDDEAEKIKLIQKEMKAFLGSEKYNELFNDPENGLNSLYSLLDVRHYSIKKDKEFNQACISIRWIANLNGTFNFCGLHTIDEKGNIFFEVNRYAVDKNQASDIFFSNEQIMDLLEVSLASLAIIYQKPQNQKLLTEGLTKSRSEEEN